MLLFLAGLVSGVLLAVLALAIWLWPDAKIRLPHVQLAPLLPVPAPVLALDEPPWQAQAPTRRFTPEPEPAPATSKLLD